MENCKLLASLTIFYDYLDVDCVHYIIDECLLQTKHLARGKCIKWNVVLTTGDLKRLLSLDDLNI